MSEDRKPHYGLTAAGVGTGGYLAGQVASGIGMASVPKGETVPDSVVNSYRKENRLRHRVKVISEERGNMGPHGITGWANRLRGMYTHDASGKKINPKAAVINMVGRKENDVLLHELGHTKLHYKVGEGGSKALLIGRGLANKWHGAPLAAGAYFGIKHTDSDTGSKAIAVGSMLPAAAMIGDEAYATGSALKHIVKKQGFKAARNPALKLGAGMVGYLSAAAPGLAAIHYGNKARKERMTKQANSSNTEALKNMGTDLAYSLPASAAGAGAGIVGAHALSKGTLKGAGGDLLAAAKAKLKAFKGSKNLGRAGVVAALPFVGYEAGGHIGSFFGRRHHIQNMEKSAMENRYLVKVAEFTHPVTGEALSRAEAQHLLNQVYHGAHDESSYHSGSSHGYTYGEDGWRGTDNYHYTPDHLPGATQAGHALGIQDHTLTNQDVARVIKKNLQQTPSHVEPRTGVMVSGLAGGLAGAAGGVYASHLLKAPAAAMPLTAAGTLAGGLLAGKAYAHLRRGHYDAKDKEREQSALAHLQKASPSLRKLYEKG